MLIPIQGPWIGIVNRIATIIYSSGSWGHVSSLEKNSSKSVHLLAEILYKIPVYAQSADGRESWKMIHESIRITSKIESIVP